MLLCIRVGEGMADVLKVLGFVQKDERRKGEGENLSD
jgi:hypothetical protein